MISDSEPGHIARFRAILDDRGVLTQADQIAPYLTDFRDLYRGSTTAVLRPRCTAEVAAVMRVCTELNIPVVPHGGNTGYCGGATPDESGREIVLSLERLDRIRDVDPLNFTLTAEAGCVLARIQEAAASADRLYPLSLGSEGSCQLGGTLATNAGGTAVLRYGNSRDLVLGLEVVLPDGQVVDGLRALRKDNLGYDLKQLFIGSEGTLGIITAAVLKLFPLPAAHVTAMLALRDVEAAVELLSRARQYTGDLVTTFELLPRIAVDLTTRHIPGVRDFLEAEHDWYAMVEFSLPPSGQTQRELVEEFLMEALEQGVVIDAALAQSEADRQAMWRMRESIPEAQRHEGVSVKHDVSVPLSSVPGLIAEAGAAVRELVPGVRLVAYGHIGDGNLHFNLSPPVGADEQEFLAQAGAVHEAVYRIVSARGGSIAAEHGVGRLKRDALSRFRSGAEYDLMVRLKQSLDPQGIMNPGKVIQIDDADSA